MPHKYKFDEIVDYVAKEDTRVPLVIAAVKLIEDGPFTFEYKRGKFKKFKDYGRKGNWAVAYPAAIKNRTILTEWPAYSVKRHYMTLDDWIDNLFGSAPTPKRASSKKAKKVPAAKAMGKTSGAKTTRAVSKKKR